MLNIEEFYKNVTPVEELIDFHPDIRVWVKRDELIHPILSGNKWRKLKYNLIQARKEGKTTLVTKGGYYSNHIAAVSEAGKIFGFNTIGIIRGEQPVNFGYTLQLAINNKMNLVFSSRNEFSDININDFENYTGNLDNVMFIPEGGTNEWALPGCNELVVEINNQIDFIPDTWAVSVGTGGTIAGMLQAMPQNSSLLGFSALKTDYHKTEILKLAGFPITEQRLIITDRFSGKGYAKVSNELIEFINSFYDKYKIALDPAYTGKMMFGINQLAKENYFKPGSNIVAIHTGGLQGVMGYHEKGIKFSWMM